MRPLRALFHRRQDLVNPDEDDIVEFEQPGDPSPEAVYLEAATHYLDAQISAYDVLDTKSNQAFSIGSLTLPITFTLINLAPDRVDIPREAFWSLWGALGAYFLMVIFIALADRHKSIEYGPTLSTIKDLSFGEYPGVLIQRWVADGYTNSSTNNAKTLRLKGRWIGWMGVSLWIEGGCLAAAAVFTVWLWV